MATEKQINANRKNSLKSTGPNTPEGKAAVSQNSIKHGLTTRQNIIKGEFAADFDLHRDQLFEQFKPSDPLENHLVQRIVILSWRLKRANRALTAAVNALQYSQKNPLVRGLDAILKPKKDASPPPPDHEFGKLTVKDFANAKVIDNLLMHERRIENSLHKTILEMQRKQMMKKIGM